ncbi:RRG7 Required for respiratory growth protein 7 [Candida maltosa Xu316]
MYRRFTPTFKQPRCHVSFNLPRRYLSFTELQTRQQYLDYCHKNNVDTESHVFKGTFYEVHVREFLEREFFCKNLVRVGGAYDQGIDIIGNWNLLRYYNDESLSSRINAKSILKSAKESRLNTSKRPISLENDINVLVQCKNLRTKPSTKIIRELVGMASFQQPNNKTNNTFIFIVTPLPGTPAACAQIEATHIPVIHLILRPLMNFNKNDVSYFNADSWTNGGHLESVYMNIAARSRLSGLNIEDHVKYLIKGINPLKEQDKR